MSNVTPIAYQVLTETADFVEPLSGLVMTMAGLMIVSAMVIPMVKMVLGGSSSSSSSDEEEDEDEDFIEEEAEKPYDISDKDYSSDFLLFDEDGKLK